MFLKAYTEIERPFDAVREALVAAPAELLLDLASRANQAGDRLLVDVGLDAAGRHWGGPATIDLGQPRVMEHAASLPLHLTVDGHSTIFPSFVGSLDVAWLGPARTQLALLAQYDPPLGVVGRAIDRALLHRVAEAVARDFLLAVAARLAGRGAQPEAEGAPAVT